MKAIVADDEPLARSYLQRLLEEHPDVEVIQAEDAAQMLRLADEESPDVVFLDIEMPGLTGLQAVGALSQTAANPLVVFVTGYSQHAVEAFELDALDYLLKPVSDERLAEALARVRRARASQRREAREKFAKGVKKEAPLRRLPIREPYAVRLVPIEKIRYAVAKDKQVLVRTATSEHKTYYSLSFLQEVLPPEIFLRVHSSCLVNINLVEQFNFLGNHSYSVTLVGGEEMPVGRTYYQDVQHRLGIDRFGKMGDRANQEGE